LGDKTVRKWADLIERRARRFEQMGIQYIHTHVPEKLTIYDDKLWDPPDRRLEALAGGALARHAEGFALRACLSRPGRAFRTAFDKDRLYFRTDSHWSGEGCYFAYRLLCERIGIGPDPDLLSRSHQSIDGVLDMGSKFDPPIYEPVKFYDFRMKTRRVFRNAIARYLETPEFGAQIHVGTHVRYFNPMPGAAKKKFLIFGDSFPSQRGDALTAMLAETVRDVEFVWSSNLDWAFIKRAKPDVVIYELVERFMTILADDKLSIRRTITRQWWKAQRLHFQARRRAAHAARQAKPA
jgi:hypothetical protein